MKPLHFPCLFMAVAVAVLAGKQVHLDVSVVAVNKDAANPATLFAWFLLIQGV